jgi:hypothetical protein
MRRMMDAHSRAGSGPEAGAETGDSERPRRDRKERVLHTRISQQLAEDIGRMAEDLRVPVSNLVRNVLEEVFSVVETVSDNVGELIEGVMDEAGRARERARHGRPERSRQRESDREPATSEPRGSAPAQEEPADLLGWQPLILARAGACCECDAPIARGARAYVGFTSAGPGALTLCADCLATRRLV